MDQGSTSSGPHRNMILEIREKARESKQQQKQQQQQQQQQRVKEISTCGLDGRIVIWNMDLILSKMNV